MEKAQTTTNKSNIAQFPPVVAVLGHVDHGKTTLLDAIRKTSIAARESGGITQKIGASSVSIMHEGDTRSITFIDTPGHEAFGQMRGRGAQAADIALLIVAANDSVKPQTKESIAILQETKTPFIVVITKTDLPAKNVSQVKQDLAREHILLEGMGGETPFIEVSAKTNHNIKELLDLIILLFDMNKPADYSETVSLTAPLKAIVIESKLDPKVGSRATVVIKNGSIHVRDELQTENQQFKVRTILNTHNQSVQDSFVGDAVELLGFEKVPAVGTIIASKVHQFIAKDKEKPTLQREIRYRKADDSVQLSVILVADTQGSLEAISTALPKGITIVSQKTGDITEADVLLAKSTGSIVLGFNVKVRPAIMQLAFTEKVLVRTYTIIYELLEEVTDALEGKIQAQMEQIFGETKVLAKFPFEKTFAYGVSVKSGRLARSDRLRVMRGDTVIGETNLASLRIGKNSTSKVEKGQEAGVVLQKPLDIQVGDVIISHS